MKADYPFGSVVNNFQKGKYHGDKSFITPRNSLKITKPFISIEIPYCELNEIKSKFFLKKFHKLTNDSFRVVITWETRYIRSVLLFHSFTWTIVISNPPKNAKTRQNLEAWYIAPWKPILTNKRTLKDWFDLEMVSRRAMNDIIQTP